jgi:hypothetical protein
MKRPVIPTIALLATLLLLGNQSMAADRIVKCQIDTRYKGTCVFIPDGGGSFSLSNPDKSKALLDSIAIVSVSIIEKGIADVRGLTTDGINSRWGTAKRSSKDGACWDGADFRVCVW